MKELNLYLYKSSIDDIEQMVECIEEFKKLNFSLRYTGREGFYSETIKLCKTYLNKLVNEHENNYEEKIDTSIMSDKIKNIGMRISRALVIISQIEQSETPLSYNEESFLNKIKENNTKHLNLNQAEWLKIIYERINL